MRYKQAWHLLLIVTDGELQVTGHNTLLLVVAGGVASELEDLSREVLENGSEVYWSSVKLCP